MRDKNKKRVRLLLVMVVMLCLCVGISIFSAHWFIDRHDHQIPMDHHWIHHELDIKDGEIPELEELEDVYDHDKKKLIGELQILQKDLSTLLLQKSESDVEIEETVKKMHQVHGKIQKLAIKHYFDMMKLLPEEKKKKLKGLAVESLSAPS